MDAIMIGWLIIGGVGGFYVGRWWAEDSRGHYEAERAWDNRSAYRKRK